MKKYFVAGTDTDCGKTYITANLVNIYNKAGYKTLAIKPIASGARELLSEDAVILQQACGNNSSLAQINPWCFEKPVSPHLASTKKLSISEIIEFCNEKRTCDYLFIEGAGGLMVPLNYTQTWLELLKAAAFDVILVVGIKLGCINHALLTQQALTNNYINCAGWIASYIPESQNLCMAEGTFATLKKMLKIPYLGKADFKQQLRLEQLF